MRELSLSILDIVQNSVKAGASLISVEINETEDRFSFTVTDDGCGMTPELLARVKDPFTTTRTTRKVGLGIPLLTLAARQTGGDVFIRSQTGEAHGTELRAEFNKKHIDFTPPGDLTATVVTLVQGMGDIDLEYVHHTEKGDVRLSTRQLREVLGDVPLSEPEVLSWVNGYLREQYECIKQ